MRKLLLLFFGFIALCILSIMVFNASTQISLQARIEKENLGSLSTPKAFQSLQKALQINTLQSNTEQAIQQNSQQFRNLLAKEFPKLHALKNFESTTFQKNNLAYKWQGSQGNAPYIVLIAPYHVYNFEDKFEKAYIQNDTLLGTGALQSKTALVALLAAMENLVEKGVRPKRNILILAPYENDLLQFGNLRHMIAEMEHFNLQYAHILYAGSGNFGHNFLGLEQSTALIGISDKQVLNLTLISEIPANITIALNEIKKYNLPLDLNATSNKAFLDYLAPEAGFTKSIYLSNTWIVEFLAKSLMKEESRLVFANELNISGWKESMRDGKNAITLNLQLPVHWSKDAFLKLLEKELFQKLQISYTVDYFLPAHSPQHIANKSFELLQTTIKQTFGNYTVLPIAMDKATGAAYLQYQIKTPVLYYAPYHFHKNNYLQAYHGYEEAISKRDFENMIYFYIQYLKNANI